MFGARAFRWPFSEREVDKLITTLSRHKDSLMLAMVTDQMWVPPGIELKAGFLAQVS